MHDDAVLKSIFLWSPFKVCVGSGILFGGELVVTKTPAVAPAIGSRAALVIDVEGGAGEKPVGAVLRQCWHWRCIYNDMWVIVIEAAIF